MLSAQRCVRATAPDGSLEDGTLPEAAFGVRIGGRTLSVSSFDAKSRYDLDTPADDLALLELSEEVTDAQPSPVLQDTREDPQRLTHLSWGPTSLTDTGTGGSSLTSTTCRRLDEQRMTDRYGPPEDDGSGDVTQADLLATLCPSNSLTFGDSGSPVIATSPDSEDVAGIFGVLSFSGDPEDDGFEVNANVNSPAVLDSLRQGRQVTVSDYPLPATEEEPVQGPVTPSSVPGSCCPVSVLGP